MRNGGVRCLVRGLLQKDACRVMDEDFGALSDPEFLAERRRVREELEHMPEHELSPELVNRYQRLDEEFLRRASLAWAQPR